MKKIYLFLLPLTILGNAYSQTVKNANLSVSNIDNNVWFESYDDSKRMIKNLNFMALCDGENSEFRTEPFVIKLYLYNKERYDATQEVYYIKTYEVPYMKHFGSWEVKNANVSFCDMDIVPGVYRLGFYVDADNVIQEENEQDNMVLFQGELNIGEKKCSGSETTNTTTTTPTETPADPDQMLKDEIASLENSITEQTKQITAIEFDLNQNKATMEPVDIKIKELEKQELELRRESNKQTLERKKKELSKKLTTDELQSYTAKEEEFKLKADSVKKQKDELIALKNSNKNYAQQVKDIPTQMEKQKSDLGTNTLATPLDSINYKIQSLELENNGYKFEAAKLGLERTNMQIQNQIASGTPPYTTDQINQLQQKENEYNQKSAETNSKIQEQLKLKKEAEKSARKEANQEKIDNSKLKMKIQGLKAQISSKEKALAKEEKKKKPNQEKIDILKADLEKLRKELSEAEQQLNK